MVANQVKFEVKHVKIVIYTGYVYREEYTGIKPPVLRSEMDFDPGAKYHVPANIPYLR